MGFKQVNSNNDVKQNDLQIFQFGQVSEGPFFNNPQTVDILHRTTGRKIRENISNYNIAVCQLLATNKHRKTHAFINRSESQAFVIGRLILRSLNEMQNT